LFLKALTRISIDVGDEQFSSLVTLPGVIICAWARDLLKWRYHTTCFLKQFSFGVFFVILVLCHSSRKFQCKAFYRRPEFRNHKQFWLFLFIFDDGYDIDSISPSWLWCRPKYFFVAMQCLLSDWIIYILHAKPLASV
jgi:hypothetical protein